MTCKNEYLVSQRTYFSVSDLIDAHMDSFVVVENFEELVFVDDFLIDELSDRSNNSETSDDEFLSENESDQNQERNLKDLSVATLLHLQVKEDA